MAVQRNTLYIFAGLPGSGKSTVAQLLSQHLGCTYLRIDTIEQGLRDLCDVAVEGEGYAMAYRIAADNLKNGQDVIADSCNPIQLTRDAWVDVARALECDFRNVEVICADANEHRSRVEGRTVNVPNLVLPDWEKVVNREYHPWHIERIVLDTAGVAPEASLASLLESLGE